MKSSSPTTRRDFLKVWTAFSSGLVIGFHLSFTGRLEAAETADPSEQVFKPNAFLRIGADGRVTVIVGKAEMGQGVYTSLPMIIAEELEAEWESIRVESAPVDSAYNHTAFGSQMTGGSSSVWSSYDQLRRAGALAKMMLIAAAAETWKVSPASCVVRKGLVVHEETERWLSFGQLANRAARLAPPSEVKLKDPKDFKIIGKATKRLDSEEKVTGRAVFGLDVRLPDMLTAVIARPPVFGAKLKNFNAAQALSLPGVKAVFPVTAGVAVVATDFWQANRGRDALTISWDQGPEADLSSAGLRERFAELTNKPGKISIRLGNPEEALASALVRLDASYEVPYLAHAPMEPLNCVVDLRPDACRIWTGTQFQTGDRAAAARIANLKPEQVKIHTTFLGGGFGRRGNPASDFVTEAVEVAKILKAPVKVMWTREDDIRGGYYRPMFLCRLAAGLGPDGKPLVWTNRIVTQSILVGTPFEASMVKGGIDATSVEGAADLSYGIPNLLVDLHAPRPPIPVLWWRSVGHSGNAFITESFIDELAHAAEQDPFKYRQALLRNQPRHRAVLELAAAKAGWGQALPDGVGRGIAVHESFKSYVAQVAEVSVDKEGKVKVRRVVCAVDCGLVVNPMTVEAQMQGAIAFGLSAALYSAITFRDGRVQQSNFHDYKVLRLTDMPKVEVYLLPSQEKQGGIGEPGVPPIAPAVTNAIFALTGKRIRRLPINPQELKSA